MRVVGLTVAGGTTRAVGIAAARVGAGATVVGGGPAGAAVGAVSDPRPGDRAAGGVMGHIAAVAVVIDGAPAVGVVRGGRVIVVVVGNDGSGHHAHAEHDHAGGGDILAAVPGGLGVDNGGRGGALHPHVGHIVARMGGRNGVDGGRYRRAVGPRPGRRSTDEPGALVAPVVVVVDQEDLVGGVDRVAHLGTLDDDILGCTGVEDRFRDLGRGHAFGGGHRGEQDGIPGLLGAGYRGLDQGRRAVVRNPGKVGRQVVARRCPGTIQSGGAEPATGHQEVVALLATVQEQRAVGVDHLHERGSGNGRVARLAVGENQFGRLRGREHDGWGAGLWPGRNVFAHYGPVFVGRQGRKHGGQGRGNDPRTAHRVTGGHPGGTVKQVAALTNGVEQHIPVGVDRKHQVRPAGRNRLELGFPEEHQEDGRTTAGKNFRRLQVDLDRRLDRLLSRLEIGEHPVERHDGGLAPRQQFIDDLCEPLFLGTRQVGEPHLPVQRLGHHLAGAVVDRGAGRHFEDPEPFLLGPPVEHGNGAAEVDFLIVRPGVDLWLVDGQALAAGLEEAWPSGVGSVARR